MLTRKGVKGNLCKCKLIKQLEKIIWRFLKTLKIKLPYKPAILLLGIYPKKLKTLILKDMHTPKFIAALFKIAKIWNQSKCLTQMNE